MKLASQNSIKGNGIEELSRSDKMNALVLKELQSAGKAGGLSGIEIIEGVVLTDEEWTSANVSATLMTSSRLFGSFSQVCEKTTYSSFR